MHPQVKLDKKPFLQVERLQGIIAKLKAENVEYQNNSKTQQFEDSIQELQQKLKQTGTLLLLPLLHKSLSAKKVLSAPLAHGNG